MATANHTLNGCYHTDLSVHPKNWETTKSITKAWYIHYRFFDPQRTKGRPKQVIIKQMNVCKETSQRRAVTRALIQDELFRLNRGWNPYLGAFMIDRASALNIIRPDHYFLDALSLARTRMTGSERHLKDIDNMLKRMGKAIKGTAVERVPIGQSTCVDFRHALNLLQLTPYMFNKYRAYLSSLCSNIMEEDALQMNPVSGVKRRMVHKNMREVLDKQTLNVVLKHINVHSPNFWRFCMIFMHSGARTTELLRLRYEDVNLARREFTCHIHKGGGKTVQKAILKPVLDLWVQQMATANPGDYVFSTNDLPGKTMRKPNAITQKWRYLVKGKAKSKHGKQWIAPPIKDGNATIKVTADFYSLKHALLSSVDEQTAKAIANHDNISTTAVYRYSAQQRVVDMLKELDIDLV